jgi:predicted enzyme related to lactoylglutathione lyase
MANPFIWYELMTSDTEAAKAFYREVVGWETEPFGGSNDYTILSASGRGIGGVMNIPADAGEAGARPCWFGYVAADDVDAAVTRIVEAGGRLHRDIMDIPYIGRIAMVSDPQGASFYLIAPSGENQPPADPMTPGHIGWHELYALDGDSAFSFYADQFGWQQVEAMEMGPMGIYRIFAWSDNWAGGIMTKPEQIPRPLWLFYFVVGDIDEAAARVTRAGGTVMNGPMEVPGSAWIIQGSDPQGAMFALVGRRGSNHG